jgi:dihydroorotate dehydrogenase
VYGPLLRPLLFALPPDTAHGLALLALGLPERLPPLRALLQRALAVDAPSLAVRTMGLTFPNPVGLAAGFDKDGRRPRALAALGFGHLELGTVTARAQAENPRPNLFRLPADEALVNRLGFPNGGAASLARRLQGLRSPVPVGISIGKSRAVDPADAEAVGADYEESFLAVAPVADFVVVNVSSPNTPGLRTMQRADSARSLLARLLERRASLARKPPLLLKVAPDLAPDDYDALLDVVTELALDGLVATNTTINREALASPASAVEAAGAGGLSGRPLRAKSLAMVRHARARLGPGPTVIGVGGVFDAEHARAMLDAGANLCQLYTGFVYRGPAVARSICRALADESSLGGLAAPYRSRRNEDAPSGRRLRAGPADPHAGRERLAAAKANSARAAFFVLAEGAELAARVALLQADVALGAGAFVVGGAQGFDDAKGRVAGGGASIVDELADFAGLAVVAAGGGEHVARVGRRADGQVKRAAARGAFRSAALDEPTHGAIKPLVGVGGAHPVAGVGGAARVQAHGRRVGVMEDAAVAGFAVARRVAGLEVPVGPCRRAGGNAVVAGANEAAGERLPPRGAR